MQVILRGTFPFLEWFRPWAELTDSCPGGELGPPPELCLEEVSRPSHTTAAAAAAAAAAFAFAFSRSIGIPAAHAPVPNSQVAQHTSHERLWLSIVTGNGLLGLLVLLHLYWTALL